MLPKGFEHDPVLLRSGSFPRPAATLFLGSESVALFSAVAISLSDVITAMAVQGGGALRRTCDDKHDNDKGNERMKR